jgi:hypothetical protein
MKEYINFTQRKNSLPSFDSKYKYRLVFFKNSDKTIPHRTGDGPAIIWNTGSVYYYKNGIEYLK